MKGRDRLGYAGIGQRIRQLREQRGLSLRAMGEKLHLRAATLCEIETGKRQPHWRTLTTIGKFFGLKAIDLWQRT